MNWLLRKIKTLHYMFFYLQKKRTPLRSFLTTIINRCAAKYILRTFLLVLRERAQIAQRLAALQ